MDLMSDWILNMVLRDASIAHLKIRGRVFSYFVIMGVFFLLLFCSSLETLWSTCFAKMWLASQITKYTYSTAMKIFGSQDKRVFFEEKKYWKTQTIHKENFSYLFCMELYPKVFFIKLTFENTNSQVGWPVLLLNSGYSSRASKLKFPYFLLSLLQS